MAAAVRRLVERSAAAGRLAVRRPVETSAAAGRLAVRRPVETSAAAVGSIAAGRRAEISAAAVGSMAERSAAVDSIAAGRRAEISAAAVGSMAERPVALGRMAVTDATAWETDIGTTITATGTTGRTTIHMAARAGGGHPKAVSGYVAATARPTGTAILEEGAVGRTAARGPSAKASAAVRTINSPALGAGESLHD
jgi:hypothetical protein